MSRVTGEGTMGRPKMLIIEDEFLSRNLLGRYLHEYGPCDIAVNGEEALHACEEARARGAPYDIVFLDLVLPGINGETVLRRLRAREDALGLPPAETSRVVLVTALNEGEIVLDACRELAQTHIAKPYSKARIDEVVRGFGFTAA